MRLLSEQWSRKTELCDKPSQGLESCFEAQSCPVSVPQPSSSHGLAAHQTPSVRPWTCLMAAGWSGPTCSVGGAALCWLLLFLSNLSCPDKCLTSSWTLQASVLRQGLRLCSYFQYSIQRRNCGWKSSVWVKKT